MKGINGRTLSILAAGLLVVVTATAKEKQEKRVGITADMLEVTVKHNGKDVKIIRNQDTTNTIDPAFAKTSRPCPPFCIQPMKVAEGVETIGEVEVINYAKKMSEGDNSILLVDSRTPDWVARGTIPGAVNISWVELTPGKGATTEDIVKIMTTRFGVKLKEGKTDIDVDEAIADGNAQEVFDFSDAKTLVLFCNGMWCGQSPTSIRALLRFGYPADKLKYYRGGMQDWEILGLSTAK